MEAVNAATPEGSCTLHEIAGFGLEMFAGMTTRTVTDIEILLAHSAGVVSPELSLDHCRRMFAAALKNAIAKHPDLPLYIDTMIIAALGILPYVYRINWDEFVES